MNVHLNRLLKDYVTENHGSKVWDRVLERDGMKKNFTKITDPDNDITENTIAAILEITGVSKTVFMESLGEFHFQHVLRAEGVMLRNVAKDWTELLQNFDYLQWIRADEILGPLGPFTFRCELGEKQDHIFLHCYSRYTDFYLMVKGALILGIRELYSQEACFELKAVYQETSGLFNYVREHAVFLVSIKEAKRKHVHPPPTFTCQTRKYAEKQIQAEDVVSCRNQTANFTESSFSKPQQNEEKTHGEVRQKKRGPIIPMHMDNLPLTPVAFVYIFPYHVVINSSVEILQTGVHLQRQLPASVRGRPLLSAFFDLINPTMAELCYKNILHFMNSPFVLKVKQTSMAERQMTGSPLLLKGQMVPLQDSELVLYLCSPLVRSFHELESSSLSLCDIPLHDPTRDILFENCHRSAVKSCSPEKQLIPDSRSLKFRTLDINCRENAIDKENAQFNTVLLPKSMKQATNREQLPKPDYSNNVTVLFCDIVNFASITKTCTPAAIVELINELYLRFDEVTDKYDTFRVESIGDAYLVISGAPQAVFDHVTRIACTSLAMLGASKQVRGPKERTSFVSIRIGVHTGGIIWGTIGDQVPRFVVMGETVMIASRMESHGFPDKVHVTQQVYDCLKDSSFNFEKRGLIEMKAVGILETYFLLGVKSMGKESI